MLSTGNKKPLVDDENDHLFKALEYKPVNHPPMELPKKKAAPPKEPPKKQGELGGGKKQ